MAEPDAIAAASNAARRVLNLDMPGLAAFDLPDDDTIAPPVDERERRAIQLARREVMAMLGNLDSMLPVATALGQNALRAVTAGGLHRFREFRSKVEDFLTLVMLIDGRLGALGSDAPTEGRALLNTLYARMMVRFVSASRHFFERFANLKVLPLGTQEMCQQEMRALHELRAQLDDPRFNSERGSQLRNDTEVAITALQQVMDRAPALLEFEGRTVNGQGWGSGRLRQSATSGNAAPTSFGLARSAHAAKAR